MIVIPDGSLGRLPFGALITRGRFWAERFVIQYGASLKTLAISARARTIGGEPVVLADPIGDLPNAADEAKRVARILGVRPHLGADANLGVLAEATNAPVLHLATHSGIDARGPWIQFADGRLSTEALLEQRVAPRLAVVASCASASRAQHALWNSITGAFLANGTTWVVSTMWSIDDRKARRFIQDFYGNGGVVDPGMALAKAQRDAIKRGVGVDEWAPYIVYGPALGNIE